LLSVGISPIAANATNTVGIWPASIASAGAYRNELVTQGKLLYLFGAIGLAGGLIRALLLLITPPPTFTKLIPFLLLAATLLFAFGGSITKRLRERVADSSGPAWLSVAGSGTVQFFTAIYGGYFGAGLGILLLAALSLIGMDDIHEMNGLKAVLSTFINGIAAFTFVLAGALFWPYALIMMVGTIAGGYGGAAFARRLDPVLVRRLVIVFGLLLTAYYFVQAMTK
jgi:uncharacterized membrane protein YfcA